MKSWMRWALIVLVVLAAAFAAVRALKGRNNSAAAVAASAASAPVEQSLEVGPQDVLEVARSELARGLEVSGSLKAVDSAFLKAKVAAELKTMTVREGDSVKAGQVLAQLDSTEFDWRLRQAEQQAEAAKAQLEIAERQLTNNKALVAQGFISPTALETTASTEAGARATLLAAQAAVELARKARADCVLTAPISGQISQRLVQPGERVPLDAKLLEIVDLSRLELEAAIAPDALPSLRVGHQATLHVDGSQEDLLARVVRINPSAQAGTRTISVYLAVQPNAVLRQGLFARGWIDLERRQALQIPLAAVRTDQSVPYAVRIVNGRAERAVLTLGTRGQNRGIDVVEILGGLAAGDRVLSGNVGLVPAGVAVRITGPRTPAAAPAASAAPSGSATSP
jgi:RND family efflux transporter MFP subunit